MAGNSLGTHIRQMQPKMHGAAIGMTLAIGSTFLSQGCPLVGQCTTCGACLPRLPLLAIPLAADGLVFLATKLSWRRSEAREDPPDV
jgi:hypothetical protein